MANTLLLPEERTLTPEQVALIDRRRRRGQLLIVMGFQFAIVATLVTLWAGQDATYSPGWARPMVYWDAILWTASLVSFVVGLRLRRGLNEFFSY